MASADIETPSPARPPTPPAPAPPVDPTAPPLTPAEREAVADDQGRIAVSAPCGRCRYELRGLPLDARCPECALAVPASLHGQLLRFASPAYLRHLTGGATWIVLGTCLTTPLILPQLLAAYFLPEWSMTVWAVSLCLGLASLWGAWRLASRRPARNLQEPLPTGALVRGLVVALIATHVATLLRSVWGEADIEAQVLVLLGYLLQMTFLLSLGRLLADLAGGLPDLALARRARRLMRLLVAAGVPTVLVTVAGIIYVSTGWPSAGAYVFWSGVWIALALGHLAGFALSIALIVLMVRFRRRFIEVARQQAESAERSSPLQEHAQ